MTPSVSAASGAPAPLWRRAFDWWLVQVKHVLPPTIFFFFGFNLILFTRWMTLEEYGIPFTNFFAASLAALLVGKAVLVVDNLRFMRHFDGAPLIQPILFKSTIYWVCVFVFRLAEGLLHFLRDGGALGDFPNFLVAQFSWPRFLAIQIWLMVLFLVYVTAHELNTLFGDGELPRLFLRWHSSEAKLTRRQRIRLLTRLNRLTETAPVEVISDKSSSAHTELVGILRELAARRGERSEPANGKRGAEIPMSESLPAKVTVRRAAPQDEKRWRELFDSYCLFYKRPLSEALARHTWARILDDASPIHAIVAEDRKEGVIGIANYVIHEHTLGLTPVCYLGDLFVDPAQRAAGVGEQMIGWLVAEMKREGWSRLYWHTRLNNYRARGLYDKFTPHSDFVRYTVYPDG